jgi:hypothetical protein
MSKLVLQNLETGFENPEKGLSSHHMIWHSRSQILNWHGFHPIPLGVSEKEGKEKKRKKGKREKLWKIKHILFALLNSSYAVIQ